MLVLTRKVGEQIVLDGNIHVTVISIESGRVRLGITARADIKILRGELAGEPTVPGMTRQ
jgi:carbon storage regulator